MGELENIGWVGTGVMGESMARRLHEAGFSLWVTTRTRSRARRLVEAGARWVDAPAELAAECDVVVTLVGYPEEVEEVYLGERGILTQHAGGPLSLVVDMTTSSPALARRVAEVAATKGIAALDAPVSGGDVGARNGTLSIMVGGERSGFDAARPLFEPLGKTIVLQGPAGSGQHTKMVNQIFIASTMVGVCEGLLYAERSGLDPGHVLESVGGGAAGSWTVQNLAPRMLRGDFAPGFFVEHFIKDMTIALEEAEKMGLELPGLASARRLYATLRDLGHGRSGTQALLLALRHLNDG